MDWFKGVKNFKLEVYDENIETYLRAGNFREFIIMDYADVKRLFDIDVPYNENIYLYLARKGMISASWAEFNNWWFSKEGGFQKYKLLYRGITKYNFRHLLNIRKYGNDRHHPLLDSKLTIKEAFDYDIKLGQQMLDDRRRASNELEGYLPGEFIWASEYFKKAWEYANKSGKEKKTIILMYDKSKMYTVKDSNTILGLAWVPYKGYTFNDCLLAIVRIIFN